MGCGGSKVENQPLVILCRERKELIKAASHHRCALAVAHLSYFQSLYDVGESIKRFVDEELVVVGSSSSSSSSSSDSPVLHLPSEEGKSHKHHSSSTTSVSHSIVEEEEEEEDSHLHLSSGSEFDSGSESGSNEQRLPDHFQLGYPPTIPSNYPPDYPPGYSARYQYPGEEWGYMGQNPNPNPYPGMYFMKKSVPPSRPVVFQPENHRVENGMDYNSYFPGNPNTGYFGYPEERRAAPSPVKPPPSPPSVSPWDFFNVFDTYDYNRAGASESSGYPPVRSDSSSPDSREVREREGIPDLEEETEQDVMAQTLEHMKKKVSQQLHGNERKMEKREDSGEGTSMAEPVVENSFGSKTVSSFSSSEEEGCEEVAKKSVGEEEEEEEYVRKKGVSFELEENGASFGVESSKISSLSTLSVHVTRDLKEVVKDIKTEFEIASSHGKEVAVLLEVSKLPYQQKSSALKGKVLD